MPLQSYRVHILNYNQAFLLSFNVTFRVVVRAVLLALRLHGAGLKRADVQLYNQRQEQQRAFRRTVIRQTRVLTAALITNLIVRILLRGVIVSELLSECVHPGWMLCFLIIVIFILIQLILLSLAAFPTRFSRRYPDFCAGNKLVKATQNVLKCNSDRLQFFFIFFFIFFFKSTGNTWGEGAPDGAGDGVPQGALQPPRQDGQQQPGHPVKTLAAGEVLTTGAADKRLVLRPSEAQHPPKPAVSA